MEILLWFIPILVTIIVSVWVTKKYVMKPKLKCYILEVGSIFSKEISELSKLKITHNDIDIIDEIISLKMLIVNEGLCDITKNMIIEPMEILYDTPLEILDIKIEEKYKIKIDCNGNKFVIKWELLKKDESFIVEVLLKHKKNDDKNYINNFEMLKKYIKIKSRIENVDEPKIDDLSHPASKRMIFLLFILLLNATACIYTSYYYAQCEIYFSGKLFDQKEYTINVKNDKELKLKNEKNKKIMTFDEFNNIEKIEKITIKREKKFGDYLINSLFCLIIIICIIGLYIELKKYFRYKKMEKYLQ